MLDKNLIGLEPDFSKNSNYNPDANVAQVKFGADAPVLEVELNELQQVQDKAREDLIRSMIPSGFTKPVEIDFAESSYNFLSVAKDAEAYVNGIRIFIPKGTKIDIGDSPTENAREDLVFLEVWKEEVSSSSELTKFGGEGQATIPNNLVDPRVGEETSRRIINKWRIRCAHNAPFDSPFLEDGLGYYSTNNMSTTVYPFAIMPQGGLSEPFKAKSNDESYMNMFRKAKINSSDWQRLSSVDDEGLFIAGSVMYNSVNCLNTADKLVYAIPMFRLHRRPNQGFCRGDYTSVAPNTDPTKLHNILANKVVGGVKAGDLSFKLKGRTLLNLADLVSISNKDFTNTTLNVVTTFANQVSKGIPLNNFIVGRKYTALFKLKLENIRRNKDGNIIYTEVAQVYSDSTPSEYPRFDIEGEGNIDITTKVEFIFKDNTRLILPQLSARDVSGKVAKAELLIVEGDISEDDFPTNITTGFNHVGILNNDKYETEIKAITSDSEESVMLVQTDEPLKGFKDSYSDSLYSDGVVRTVVKELNLKDFNSSLRTTSNANQVKTICALIETSDYIADKIMCDKLPTVPNSDFNTYDNPCITINNHQGILIRVAKEGLETQDIEGVKKWLTANNPKAIVVDKSALPSIVLPNGITNFDDGKGNITKNIDVLKSIHTLNWNLDGAVTQEENILRFFYNFADKYDVGDGIRGNDLFCPKIATKSMNNLNDATPRLWGYWQNSIYIDVSCSDIGCKLGDPNETKVAKLKSWLATLNTEIYYRKANMQSIKYSVSHASILGDIILASKESVISFNSNVKPVLELSRPSHSITSLYAGSSLVQVDGGIMPSKFTVADTIVTNDYNVKLNPQEDQDKVPVNIEGNTLLNIHNKQVYTFGTSLEAEDFKASVDEGYAEVTINNFREGRYYLLNAGEINCSMLEPNTTYTLIAEEATDGLSPSIKTAGYQYLLTQSSTPFKDNIATITTNDLENNFKNQILYIELVKGNTSKQTLKNVMIVKGEVTRPVPYFEGLYSLGDNGAISINSCNGNIAEPINKEITLNLGETTELYRLNQTPQGVMYQGLSLKGEWVTGSGTIVLFYDEHKNRIEWLTMNAKPRKFDWKNLISRAKYYSISVSHGESVTFDSYYMGAEENFKKANSDFRTIHLEDSIRCVNQVKDTVDDLNSTITRRLNQYIITGDEDWIKSGQSGDTTELFYVPKRDSKQGTRNIICDKFVVKRGIWEDTKAEGIAMDEQCNIMVRISKSKLESPTTAGFKKWLKQNPITLIYELATPVVEPIISKYSSGITSRCSFEGQLGLKKNWNSGIDCPNFLLSDSNIVTNVALLTSNCMKEMTYSEDRTELIAQLVGVPLVSTSAIAQELGDSSYTLEIVKLLPNRRCLIRNTCVYALNPKGERYSVARIASTRPDKYSTFDLQKRVSLTGNDYTYILDKAVKDYLY